MIKALIFDMDDTLANSSKLHKKAFDITLKKYGVSESNLPAEVIKEFHGKKISDIAQEMVFNLKLPITSDQLLAERKDLIDELLKQVEPMPGFTELKKYLDKTDKILVLASSSRRIHVDLILDVLKIKDLFKIIVSGDEVINGKPAPDIFLLAAKKINISPEECLVIEDSKNGISAAKKAGMKCIGMRNEIIGFNLDLSEADFIAKDLSEIEEIIEKIKEKNYLN